MNKKTKLISAEEACAIYKEAKELEIKETFRIINDGIIKAYEDGELHFSFKTKELTNIIVPSLKLAGYLVDVDPTDSDFIIIYWDHLLKNEE